MAPISVCGFKGAWTIGIDQPLSTLELLLTNLLLRTIWTEDLKVFTYIILYYIFIIPIISIAYAINKARIRSLHQYMHSLIKFQMCGVNRFSFRFKVEKFDTINVVFNKYEDVLFSSYTYSSLMGTNYNKTWNV